MEILYNRNIKGIKIMNDRMRTEITRQTIILFEEDIAISKIIRILWDFYPNKPKENIKTIVTRSIEMIKSLIVAVDHAEGGCGSINEFSKKSILDLISILAPNQIRFVYQVKKTTETEFHNVTKSKCKYYKKIEKLKIYVKNMISDFEKQLEEDGNNIIAAFGIETYTEIEKQL
jgi:hypothetical protein